MYSEMVSSHIFLFRIDIVELLHPCMFTLVCGVASPLYVELLHPYMWSCFTLICGVALFFMFKCTCTCSLAFCCAIINGGDAIIDGGDAIRGGTTFACQRSVLDSHSLGQSSIACYLPNLNISTGLFLATKLNPNPLNAPAKVVGSREWAECASESITILLVN